MGRRVRERKHSKDYNAQTCLCVLLGGLRKPLAETPRALKVDHWDERKSHLYTAKYGLSDMTKK